MATVSGYARALNNRVARNITSNYIGAAISATAPLLALPVLVRALGPSLWGVVAFTTLLISALAILNAGLAQSMMREIGMRWSAGERGRVAAKNLLYGYERIYWCAALLIALAVVPLAGVIVRHWLNLGEIPEVIGIHAVVMAAFIFFAQLPSALYRTTLSALQEQVALNVVQVTATIARTGGGVAVAALTHDVIAYLAWLVVVSFAETLALAVMAWSHMPQGRVGAFWKLSEISATFKFSAVMIAVVIIGVLTTMIDKFYVSSKFPIESLGVYTIASGLGLGVLQMSFPIFNAILPKLVEIGDDHASRHRANVRVVFFSLGLIVVSALLYASFGRPLVELWLGDFALARKVSPILDLVLVSSALNLIYNVSYTNWVSLGASRWIFLVNVSSFLAALVLTPFFIHILGLKGAATAMIVNNAIGASASIYWLAKSRRNLIAPALERS